MGPERHLVKGAHTHVDRRTFALRLFLYHLGGKPTIAAFMFVEFQREFTTSISVLTSNAIFLPYSGTLWCERFIIVTMRSII